MRLSRKSGRGDRWDEFMSENYKMRLGTEADRHPGTVMVVNLSTVNGAYD